MSDSDSEYEETEYLVYADFKNHLAPHQLKHEDAAIRIIAIESETPMAEINGNIFKGSYDMALGTNVFFEKDTNSVFGDPLYEPVCRQQYKYVNKSDKVISFERVYIENLPQDIKVEEEHQPEEAKSQSLKLNISYRDAINKFGKEQ
ncbi:GH19984 [Drosophila grimshawi]|uniref:GH19984 n=2 Tax=Drosophila grimshawi TaxID=7222 RepID=B4J8B9_DROGR|nr:GH19984 [Drosophila grimshawi]